MNSPESPVGSVFSLAQIQRWMQTVITHPDGVSAGVDSASSADQPGIDSRCAEEIITRSSRQTSMERLQVYAHAYVARLLEVLAAEYPALQHALGADLFQTFAAAYLQQQPSRSYTLSELGAGFPGWLQANRPARAADETGPDWADFLVDLATLERTYSDVFDGPGMEGRAGLQPGDLTGIDPQQWPLVCLDTVPCLRLLPLRFPIHEYVTAVRQQQEPEAPAADDTWLAVTRREFVVRRTPLTLPAFTALKCLQAGGTVGEALTQAHVCWTGPADRFASALETWFREWSAAGYFLAVRTPAATGSDFTG